MQTELTDNLQDAEEKSFVTNIAVVVTNPNVNEPPSGILLASILEKIENYDLSIELESIFLVSSLREAPLLAQSLSESMLYDGIIVIDIISPNDNLAKLLLPSVTSAIHNVELENGVTIYQAIYLQSDINSSASGLNQLAESILSNFCLYFSQNLMIRMNGVEFSEGIDDDEDDDNPF